MHRLPVNIVWLKRDLRTQDHAPLQAAQQSGLPCILLFLLEPSLMAAPDTSLRHLQFQYLSVMAMNATLAPHGLQVTICYTEATTALEWLAARYHIQQVYSYRESGTQMTWNRDKAVAALLASHGIGWTEFQRDGILRGIRNRVDWDVQWFACMHQPIVHNTYTPAMHTAVQHPFALPPTLLQELNAYPATMQPPGEDYASQYLQT